jgi:hypothetical protein
LPSQHGLPTSPNEIVPEGAGETQSEVASKYTIPCSSSTFHNDSTALVDVSKAEWRIGYDAQEDPRT